MLELAAIIVLGIFAQWIAWRMRIPAIFPLIRKEFSFKNKTQLSKLSIFDKRQFIWVCKNNHEYKNSIFRRIFYNERCIDCYDKEIELRKPLHDPNETKFLK